MSRLILVGEAPGGTEPVTSPELTLVSGAGRNLAAIAGWEWDDYLTQTFRLNLFTDPMPGTWDKNAAAHHAMMLLPAITGNIPVILLGRRVAEAFGVEEAPLYEWFTPGLVTPVARIPHPSGKNRVWNDPDERQRAHVFLRNLLS